MIQLQYLRDILKRYTLSECVGFCLFYLFIIAALNMIITTNIYAFSHPTLTNTQVGLHIFKSFIW